MRKVGILGMLLALLMIMSSTAFAAEYQPVDPDDQGKTGIVAGDTLVFSEDTVWANLTARWGVKVIFQDSDDYGNTVFKEEVLPVTDTENANTTAPDDPSHAGVTFTGWKRIDSNNGTSKLSDDGAVTGVNGPGPIIYQAEYSNTPEEPGTTPDDPDEPGTTPDDPDEPGDTPDDSDKPEKTPADGDAPKTGDNMNIALWLGAMLASLFGLIVLAVRKRKAFNKFMQMMLVVTLIGGMGMTGLGTKAFAADTGADYTYGSYSMTYLPGTEGTVTNMPENETGLTPGSDNPYTVSSTVPVREGFEFIDWTLTWGTMEKPATPVDYSNALTVSKTAAGAELIDRSFTITLESKVNINSDDATGLFVEDLTVTDTIEDEFVLNGVTAEILDSEGNVVSTESVSASGPTVTHNFGNVQHGHTARLKLEVTAQPDFIGSNGVYTNVGLSRWTYKHTDPEATAAEEYSVTCADTPQVNVRVIPITLEVGDSTQRMGLLTTNFMHFTDAAGDPIPNSKYDQTKGTWSVVTVKILMTDNAPETWHTRPGEEMATITTTATDGVARFNWRVPTNTPRGDYPVPVEITFTADGGPENSATSYGQGKIKVIPRETEIEIIE